jgi:hypothetical protein
MTYSAQFLIWLDVEQVKKCIFKAFLIELSSFIANKYNFDRFCYSTSLDEMDQMLVNDR